MNEKFPNPPFNPADNLMKSRIVMLGRGVDDEIANDIIARLFQLSANDPTADIYLYINSPGGSITAGSGIYDAMNLIPNDVATIGIGMCASMGQFLLTAGAPGKRFITPNARVLLHQPSGGAGGTESDIIRNAQLIDDMKHTLAKITAKNTGQTVEQVNKDGDRDSWYTATEALEYGFVDHVITSLTDITSPTIADRNNK